MIAAMTVFKLMPPASAFAVALETVSRGVPALCILWHSAWSSSSNACSFGSIAILLCGSKQFRRFLVDPVEEPVKEAAAAPAEAERDERQHLFHYRLNSRNPPVCGMAQLPFAQPDTTADVDENVAIGAARGTAAGGGAAATVTSAVTGRRLT